MLEEVVVSGREVGRIWQMRRNFIAQFARHRTNASEAEVRLRAESGPAYHCQLQALHFSVHLIDFLSVLLRCNGFTGIQKAAVDQTAADHQTVTLTFLGATLALELLLGPATQLVIASCIKSTFHCISQSI